MKKVLFILILLLLNQGVFAEDDWDPKEHWEETKKYLQEEIEDLKEWLEEEDSEKLLENIKSQISVKVEKLKMINNVFETDKRDYDPLELEIRLLNSKEHLLHIEIQLIKLKNMEELSDSEKEEIELLSELYEIKKEMLELQESEVEIEKKLRVIKKKKKIDALKKELEMLEG